MTITSRILRAGPPHLSPTVYCVHRLLYSMHASYWMLRNTFSKPPVGGYGDLTVAVDLNMT